MTSRSKDERFKEWIANYDAILWKIARSYSCFGEQEELHQDLLIALWHAVELYRDESTPSTFIYRVALNTALNWTRGRERYRQRHVALDERMAAASRVSEDDAVERLYAALSELSQADRSLALLHLDGLSYREIGEVLGITENNVGVKLNRLKARLAERLRSREQMG